MPRWIVAPYESFTRGRVRRRAALARILPNQASGSSPQPFREIEIAGNHVLARVEDAHLPALTGQSGITVLPDVPLATTFAALTAPERTSLRDMANTLRAAGGLGTTTVTGATRMIDFLGALRAGRREPRLNAGVIVVDGAVRPCDPLPPEIAGGDDAGRLSAWLWRRELDTLIREGASLRTLRDHGVIFAGSAFPTTGVIDTFTAANGVLGASWTEPTFTGDNTLSYNSNQCARTAGGGSFGNAYRNDITPGPDSEAYATGAVKSTTYNGIWIRTTSPSTATPDAYFAEVRTAAGTDAHEINRIDNGVFTTLGAAVNGEWTNGDKWGMECIGTSHVLYWFASGAWSALITRSDSTYTAAGRIGLEIDGTAGRWDDFGGGTVVTATPPRPKQSRRYIARSRPVPVGAFN